MNVVTRLQDNQDGGYTMYVYNNEDELIEDHFLQGYGDGITPEKREEILNGDNEYKNGYIDHDTIEIEVLDDGNARLLKPLRFSAGQ